MPVSTISRYPSSASSATSREISSERTRTQRPARVRNDAIGAKIHAAILNFERRTGARIAHGGKRLEFALLRKRTERGFPPYARRKQRFAYARNDFPSPARAEHEADAIECGNRLRRNLRIAANGDDERGWIRPVRTGNHLAGLSCRLFGLPCRC